MMRYLIFFFLVLFTSEVHAHGFGERYNIPVPLWLYLYGAAAVVILSFILIGAVIGKMSSKSDYWRHDLLQHRRLKQVLENQVLLSFVKAVSLGLFLLLIATALFGNQSPIRNFSPTFLWIIWWVGFGFLTVLVGNFWALVNPWKIIFELMEKTFSGRKISLDLPYPKKFGVWPSLIFLFSFIWIELIYPYSSIPRDIAIFTLFYTFITLIGMLLFGKHNWLRYGEVFSVYFYYLSKLAPTEVRVDAKICKKCSSTCHKNETCINCYECFEIAKKREINLRPYATGILVKEEMGFDKLTFVIFMLSSVTYDGFKVTPAWNEVLKKWDGFLTYLGFEYSQNTTMIIGTFGLMGFLLAFIAIYFVFSFFITHFSKANVSLKAVAYSFVLSLLPIAFVYNAAHYYTLLIIQGQGMVALISDPFGLGWNLFSTAEHGINVKIIGAGFVWYSQIGLIVLGHIIAVYLAHVISIKLIPGPKKAIRSQYPMLLLMVLYTMTSLWIIAQPIVR